MVKKAKIYDKIYDVISSEEYYANPSLYEDSYTAIEFNGMLYPVRKKNDSRPGMHIVNEFYTKYTKPDDEDDLREYDASNVIDFSNADSLRDVIQKQDKLRSAEHTILTTIDNVFVPVIDPLDNPEMAGLKQAVIEKRIDLDKYAYKFGSNYNNEKRLFTKHSISMPKLKTMMDALDMKGTLIIEDKDPNVPNPIGRAITIELLGGGEEDEEEE